MLVTGAKFASEPPSVGVEAQQSVSGGIGLSSGAPRDGLGGTPSAGFGRPDDWPRGPVVGLGAPKIASVAPRVGLCPPPQELVSWAPRFGPGGIRNVLVGPLSTSLGAPKCWFQGSLRLVSGAQLLLTGPPSIGVEDPTAGLAQQLTSIDILGPQYLAGGPSNDGLGD